jgi:toxin-antitoxin system PIN domain toxin
MYLPDINFWLALAFEIHVHHRRAAEWFEQQEAESCTFCRFTQQGFLRLATNPSVFGEEAVTMSRAWGCYDLFLLDERICFSHEPPDLESIWRKHTVHRKYSHKVWSDAYLAAFSSAAGLGVVTFDRGFRSYKGTRTTIPK